MRRKKGEVKYKKSVEKRFGFGYNKEKSIICNICKTVIISYSRKALKKNYILETPKMSFFVKKEYPY